MLLAVVVSVLGASVEVAVDAPCVEPAFSGRLANAGVVLPPDTTLSLRRARAEVLEVTLTPKGAPPMRRAVPAAARDCAGVERVVVALVKAWLASPVMVARAGRDGGARLRDAGASVDDEAPERGSVDAGGSLGVTGASVDARGVPAGVDGGSATQSRGEVGSATTSGGSNMTALAGSRAEVERARGLGDGGSNKAALAALIGRAFGGGSLGPAAWEIARAMGWPADGGVENRADVDAGPATDGGPASRADSDAGVQPSNAATITRPDAPSATPADAGADAPPWSFGAGLLGGIASGTTTDIVPQGLLSLDVTRGWFGAALDVGLSGNVSRQVAPGAVTSSWQWLSLSARAVWAPLQRVTLDAQLGVRAHRIVAVATGYAETKPSQQLFSVGAVGSVGASVRIVGPVGLTVRATGVVKPPERFTIDNLGAVLDLGSLEGGVHAGVVVRW